MDAVFRLGEIVGGAAQRHNALLRFCAEKIGVAPGRLTLARDAFYAPLLLLDGAETAWRISSASRDSIVLFGLAREKIGVDVELLSTAEPAWNVLHDEEKAALRALPCACQSRQFLRLWTAKEAYLKALGLGLRREPGEIRICPDAGSFRLFDREREVALHEARLWREKIGLREVICAAAIATSDAKG